MSAERTPCDIDEAIAVEALRLCRLMPCSFEKRFVKRLVGTHGLTERERPQLWRIFRKYRRQIHGRVVNIYRHGSQTPFASFTLTGDKWNELQEKAFLLAAPDLRKVQMEARERAQLAEMKAQPA